MQYAQLQADSIWDGISCFWIVKDISMQSFQAKDMVDLWADIKFLFSDIYNM